MRVRIPLALSAAGLITGVSGTATGAELSLKVEVPRLNVSEYHRPYVAAWLERADSSVAANLLVWYDVKKRDNEGTKWLKDMRQWWRRAGRELQLPADGVSGATRVVGEHQVSFVGDNSPLAKLPAGEYKLYIEATREHGGREVLSVPIQWPPKAAQSAKAQGSSELGAVTVELKP